ncbi:MAG TPA: adenylosuccinate lyase [Thermodesulfobacteriota bacterium]|nr:adenylosuccinate lyase [Thermodesulfobacteriota bacterium]
MAGHPIDYYVYGGSWGTDEGRKIFSEEQMIDRWLKIEAALAEAESEMGIIPEWAAKEISAKASVERIDLNLARAEQQKTRHSLVPVIRAFARACGEKAGEFVHYGPTTQDIIDTGNALALREVMDAVKRDLEAIEKRLVQITLEYADTPMAGRTHGQHALPITFGFKTASWLQEVRRHLDRLEEGRIRILVGELAGAVGSYASWGEQGRELERRTVARLGLGQSDIPWQSSRDRSAEAVLLLAMICSTLGKIAGEVYLLQKTEVDELAQGFEMGRVGSSTMPHKRNPETAEGIKGISRLVRYRAAGILEAMEGEHERDASNWKTEWVIIPEVSIYTLAALSKTRELLGALAVKRENMRANLDRTRGLILSERAMFVLGEHLGKQTAHEVVYEASMKAFETGKDLTSALAADSRVGKVLSEEAIRKFMDPVTYTGLCAQLAREVASRERKKKG